MAFIVEINGDSSDITSKLKQVGDGLDKIDAKGKTAGAGITQGMREGSASADKLRGGLSAIDQVIAEMDRSMRLNTDGLTANQKAQQELLEAVARREQLAEDDMYKRIMGPLDQYTTALGALDRLYEKDKIGASDYANQLERINAAMAKQSGPQFGPSQSQAGPSGGGGADPSAMFGMTGTSALAATGSVVALGAAMISLGDSYIKLENQAQRLVDAGHGVDDVLASQFDESEKLHGSLSDTINMTASLRAGTMDLNLTVAEQNSLMDGIAGEAAKSGEGIADLSGFMSKYALAAESGTVTSRQLRSMFSEMPALAHDMATALGTTSNQLLHTGVSITDLNKVLADSTDKQIALANRAETSSEIWGHFKDQLALTIGPMVQSSGALEAIKSVLDTVTMAIKGVIEVGSEIKQLFESIAESATGLKMSVSEVVDVLENLAGVGKGSAVQQVIDAGKAAKAAMDLLKKQQEDARNEKFDPLDKWLGYRSNDLAAAQQALTAKAAALAQSSGVIGAQAFDAQFQQTLDHTAALKRVIQETTDQLASLKQYANDGGGAGIQSQIKEVTDERTLAQKELDAAVKHSTATLSEHDRILQDIAKAQRISAEGLLAVDQLFAAGNIDLDQRNKLLEHYLEMVGKKLVTALPALPGGRDTGIEPDNSAADKKMDDELRAALRAADQKDVDQEAALYKSLRDPMLKYTDDLQLINRMHDEGTLVGDRYQADLQGLREKILGLADQQQVYLRGQQEIITASVALGASTDQQAKALDNYAKKMGEARDVSAGFADGLTSIEKELKQGGATAATKLMTDSFHSVNDAIVQLCTTGTTDWSKMIDSMIADLARLALQSSEQQLFKMVFDGAGALSGIPGLPSLGDGRDSGGAVPGSPGGSDGPITSPSQLTGGGPVTDPTGLSWHVPGGGGAGSPASQRPLQVHVHTDAPDARSLMKKAGTTREFKAAMVEVHRKNPSIFGKR